MFAWIEDLVKTLVDWKIFFTNTSFSGKVDNIGEKVETPGKTQSYRWKFYTKEEAFAPFSKELYEAVGREPSSLERRVYKDNSENSELERVQEESKSNQMVLEYSLRDKIFTVRYVFPLVMTITNNDLLTCLCNNLQHYWDTVSLELVENPRKKDSKEIKERCPSLKSSFKLDLEGNPTVQMLTTMDRLAVHAKIVQPEISKALLEESQSALNETLCEEIKHY